MISIWMKRKAEKNFFKVRITNMHLNEIIVKRVVFENRDKADQSFKNSKKFKQI